MSVWSLLAECAGQLDEPFRRSEIVGWFRRHHPEVLESTLAAHIQAATGNSTNRAQNFPHLAGRAPLLYRVDHGLYVRADQHQPVSGGQRRMGRSKYDGLREHLARATGGKVAMTFAEIEGLVGPLPPSARAHRAWWSNGSNTEAQAWRAAGWRVQSVNQSEEEVVFARGVPDQTPSRQAPATSRPLAYVDTQMVASLSAISDLPHDLTKLLKLISELNENYSRGNGYAAHALLRAILDHIPPIFGFKNFNAVANNYRWSQTDKAYMRKLDEFKLQANDVMHRQLSRTPDRLSLDDMPPRVWVNRLLEEIADQALEGQVGRTPSSGSGVLASPTTRRAPRAEAASEQPAGRKSADQAERQAEPRNDLRALRDTVRMADEGGEAGDAATARDQMAALLQTAEQILGSEHPETLMIRNRLAHWTGEAGDAAKARDQAAALLPVVERVLSPSHPDTLAVRATMARMTRAAKDPVSAGDQYAALLPIAERVLGPDHPSTLDVRAGLAWSTGEAGDAAQARAQFAAILPVVDRVLGSEHPQTLNSRAGLVRWTGSTGDAAWARDQFAALLPAFERVHGPEHPDTLYIRHSLARWTGQAGDAAGARAQFAALLVVRERILGPSHPDTVGTRKNLAHWTRKASASPASGMN